MWDQMNHDASKKFIDHYKIITAEEGVAKQQRVEAEKQASESIVEPPVGKSTILNVEPALPTAEQIEPLDVQVPEPPQQKSSPLHSPQQKVSPKGSPNQSAKHSRKSSKGSTNGEQINAEVKSPPKSPTVNMGTDKLPEVTSNNTEINTGDSQTIGDMNQSNTE